MRATMDSPDQIRRRLIAVRKFVAPNLRQTEFAKTIGLEKNVYNPMEKGARPLTMDAARRIRRRWGVSVDWLLFGDFGLDQRDILQKIGPDPDVEVETKPKPVRKLSSARR